MKKILALAAFFIITIQFSYAQKTNALTYGSVKDSVYTNSFLGLQVKIPSGWAILSKELNEKLKERGKDFINAEGNQEVMIDQSVERSAIILSTSKYEIGAPVDFNPSLIVMIENIELAPGIKSGSDYLFHAKQLMQQNSKLTYKIEPDFKPLTIGGKQFYTMNTQLESGNLTLDQRFHVTVMKGYALIFLSTTQAGTDIPEIEKLLQTVSFR
jgi:hypothetical protein